MNERLANILNKLLWKIAPKKALSRWMGKFARRPVSKKLIPLYIRYFQIDLSLAKKSVGEFEHLLDFFIREYTPEARPIDQRKEVAVSPVDGRVSQSGTITEGMLLQAKGKQYSLQELLGEQEQHIKKYMGGEFITVYLSPRDYHRIHMPVKGEIGDITYVPGELYPVNQWGVQHVPRLFARNERLITYIESTFGQVCLIKVGATNVGSIKVVYDPEMITNNGRHELLHKSYPQKHLLDKGDELGRFEFGSTIILLFEPGKIDWLIKAEPEEVVQMGQPLAKLK